MRAYRQRRKQAGYKTAKLWLSPETREKIARLQAENETLETLFERALEAVENIAPLQGKILLLQTEYITPLREEVAKLKKRLNNSQQTAAQGGPRQPAKPQGQQPAPQNPPPRKTAPPSNQETALRQHLNTLQASNQRLEQAVDLLRQELDELRQQLSSSSVTPEQPQGNLVTDKETPSETRLRTDLKQRARELYLSGLSLAEVWESLASEGRPPGSRANIGRYLAPDFADKALNAAAAVEPENRVDEDKVPVGKVWEIFRRRARGDASDYPAFKRRLLAARRAGRLELAPLPEDALPAEELRQHKITDSRHQVWHAVRLDPTGRTN